MAKDGREWIKSKESDRCEGRALLMERGEHLCMYNVYIYMCMYVCIILTYVYPNLC